MDGSGGNAFGSAAHFFSSTIIEGASEADLNTRYWQRRAGPVS